jgi:aspartate-semialdehyde dehydrogenase
VLGLWEKQAGLRVESESAPTPRSALAGNDVLVGRLRAGIGEPRALAFVVALDDLRRGAALAAVEAAEALFR